MIYKIRFSCSCLSPSSKTRQHKCCLSLELFIVGIICQYVSELVLKKEIEVKFTLVVEDVV